MREIIERYWHALIFVVSIAVAFKLRVINPWDSVFTFTVRLGGNDPWYYYRLIESCIHNFPNRIWFDPFTHYPYGSYTHFGPFLVYLGAIASIIAGATDGESIRSVLAFLPVIGGILVIFPTYLLTKEVFGKRAAAIASFAIAIIPGQFLQRSLLGFNDHHAWEVFWMTTSLSLYIFALNRWINSDRWNIRGNIILAAIAGISFGLYLDTWAPGFILGMIIAAFLYLAMLFRFNLKNVLPPTAIFFLFAALIYLPFAFKAPGLSTTKYTPLQLILLLFLSAFAMALWLIESEYERIQKVIKMREQTLLLILAFIALIALPSFAPDLYANIAHIIHVIQPRGGALTVAEVYPFFFTRTGEFTLLNAIVHFGGTFFFAIPAMLYSAYRIYKERNASEFAVLFWAFIMFVALWGQNRFAYYFAVVAAIYAAFALHKIFEKLHFYAAIENLLGNRAKMSYLRFAFAILIALTLLWPTYGLAEWESGSSGGPDKQWYDALLWLEDNTPGKEDYDNYYYQLYDFPENHSALYPYPFETYGIMSWWDYGHWIEAIAHRMPIANPFQHGIGNKYNNEPGAAPFFTAFNESKAEKIAEKLNVRYVVSDLEMATGKFYAMAVWAEGDLQDAEKYTYGLTYVTQNGIVGFAPSKWEAPPNSVSIFTNPSIYYYKTMEARFHIFDGAGLNHYRMIYESQPNSVWQRAIQEAKKKGMESALNDSTIFKTAVLSSYQNVLAGYPAPIFAQEVLIKYIYRILYQKKLGIELQSLAPTGYVKIFERVKGAKITGKAGNATEVELRVTIKTNQNRTFDYVLKTDVANDTYTFIVPYAQDTSYAVKPVTPYHIKAGNIVKELNVTEEQVLKGETIYLDLI